MATRTDGTLWQWGSQENGALGLNTPESSSLSSPVQLPGTTWPTSNINHLHGGMKFSAAIKTDGTLWTWGRNQYGALGVPSVGTTNISSPIQVGSNTDWDQVGGFTNEAMAFIQKDTTP